MENSQYWKPSSLKNFKELKLNFPFSLKNFKLGNLSNGGNVNDKFKSLLKGLGAGGIAVLAVAGVIAALVFFFIVSPAYTLLSNVNAIRNDLVSLQDAMKNRDLVTFNKTLDESEADLNNLRAARNSKFGWAADFPLTKDYYEDSNHFIEAGFHGVKAGRELTALITPFADAVGMRISEEEEVVVEEGLMDAFQSWISVMPQVADNMDGVLAELENVGNELVAVDAHKYPKSFRGIAIRDSILTAQNTLTNLNEYGPDIKMALNLIPELLGVGTGEKRYGIIMQNNAEIRATGGFWTNYATFKVKDALLSSDFSSKDMYSIDFVLEPVDAVIDFPDVPLAYERYLLVERMFSRDANISPDYPTSIDQFMYFYNLAGRQAPWEVKPVEGFIAIDTDVVRELLEVTGPVTVNGVTFTADNVVLELEKIASLSLQEQIGRKRVLGDLMEGMLVNVFESDKNLWSKLIDKGVDLAIRKHIIGYLFDPQAQSLLEKYNLSGRIVDPVDGDFAYLVSTNLGGDKTNLFVSKEVNHKLDKEGDKLVRTVTAKFTYTQPGEEYAALVKTYRDWLRLYVPAGSALIGVDGSDDGELGSKEERGKVYYSGHITLNPGETKEITFKYSVPSSVVKDEQYKLYIEKQPGINVETHTVTVNGKTDIVELKMDKQYSAAF